MSAWSRRDFLQTAPRIAWASGLAVPGSRYQLEAASKSGTEFLQLPAQAITAPGDKKWHHFFGYYDKCPWDSTGRYVLTHRVAFAARQPTADEEVTIGMVDRKDNDRFVPLAQTRAWCWQQGAMLQWLGSAAEREIIFNSLTDAAADLRPVRRWPPGGHARLRPAAPASPRLRLRQLPRTLRRRPSARKTRYLVDGYENRQK
jgi:hypothetical protein